jgi:hypothetical protein
MPSPNDASTAPSPIELGNGPPLSLPTAPFGIEREVEHGSVNVAHRNAGDATVARETEQSLRPPPEIITVRPARRLIVYQMTPACFLSFRGNPER